jgi:hypothetical protein
MSDHPLLASQAWFPTLLELLTYHPSGITSFYTL